MATRSLSYIFRGDFSNLTAGLATASRNVQEFGNQLNGLDRNGEQMRAAFGEVADAAGKVGLAATAGLGAATKAAIDWETAWAGVQKTTDGTAAQMAELEGQLRELARTMPTTHEDIAAVAEAAGQLGVQREAIAEFTKTMIMLGETTDLSADDAATAIAQMANVMGTSANDIDNLGAALVALGNDGASTESQIIQMAQRISGAGAQIGLSEANILAIANAAASMGLEVEAGGTAVSRVFTELAKATAVGGPKLQAFAETAGLTANEFKRLFAETPEQAFAAFTAGLDRLNKSGGNVFGTLEALGLSDVRVSDALLRMAAAGDLLTDSLDLGNQAWQESSALSDEFAKRADTTAAQVQVAWNNIKDAAIDVGAAVLPVVSKVAGVVADMAGAFQSLPQPVKSATAGLLAVTAVLGSGIWAASKVMDTVASLRTSMAALGVSSPRAATGMRALVTAGAGLGAVSLAASGLQAAMESLFDMRINGGAVARDLEALADGRVTKNFDNLYHTFRDIDDLWQAKANPLSWISSWDPSGAEAAQKNIKEIDSALAAMVEGGDAETAAKAWLELQKIGDEAGKSASEMTKLFPEYATALDNTASSAAAAAVETEDVADATNGYDAALKSARERLKEYNQGLREQRSAARDTANSFVGLGESLNDAEVSLDGWIQKMREQAQALKDFRINAREAAEKGLDQGLLKSLQKAGPEGALRMKQLADGTKEQIKEANDAWRAGRRQADLFAKSVGNVKNAKLGIDDSAFHARMKIARQALKELGLDKADPEVRLLLKEFARGRDKALDDLKALAEAKADPTVGLNDDPFKDLFGGIQDDLDALKKSNPSPTVGLHAEPFNTELGKVTKEGKAFADKVFSPRVTVDNDASGVLSNINGQLVNLNGKTATVNVRVQRTGANINQGLNGLVPGLSADGSTVPKTGQGYADRHLYLLADGEEVISNRYGQADRNRGLLKAINAGMLADGGSTISASPYAYAPSGLTAHPLRDLANAAHSAARGLKGLEKSLDEAQKRRDRITSAMSSYRSQVTGNFRNDPFALADSVWTSDSAMDPLSVLRGDIRDARQFKTLTARLRKRGLDSKALLEVDTLDEAQALAGLSNKELREYERLYATRQTVTANLGQANAVAVYGDELRAVRNEIRGLRRDIRREHDKDRKNADKNAKQTGREVGQQVNNAATAGQHRKARGGR